MPVHPSWKTLPSTPSDEVPPLLVSMETGPSDYTVRITDMANVWVESLDRRRICMRAWDLNTSIDPSDTPENMTKFLSSIRTALDASQSDHDQTSLVLLPGKSGDVGADGLILNITCEIAGLHTLTWNIQLRKEPISAVATSVVLPLLQAQLARTREVEALVELIHRKDSVMTKLLDKLEATGTGLEHIFNSLPPSVAGRKKISRAFAGKKIRGLAPFNQSEWQQEMKVPAEGALDVTSLMDRVFGGRGMHYESSTKLEETPSLDRWWQNFQGTKRVPLQTQSEKPAVTEAGLLPKENESAGDEDDFQVQLTPPALKVVRRNDSERSVAAPAEDLTASEDEPEPEIPLASKPSQQGDHSSARLGTIGGKPQSQGHSFPSPGPSRKAPSGHDSETASEADDDPIVPLPDSSSPPAPAKPPTRKVGLGRIGGSKPKSSQEELVVRNTSPEEAPKQPSTPKKLGIIGKRSPDKAPDNTDHAVRGRSREAVQPLREAPRETSQERADRKRDELKRELEKKAAAGPAKKKRKF